MRKKVWAALLVSLLLLFGLLVLLSPPFHDKYFGMAKYEASAVGSLDKINSLENRYAASHPDKGFACELALLRPQEHKVDASNHTSGPLGGQWTGYKFAFAECTAEANGIITHYQIAAVPIRRFSTGVRAFCTDQTGKLFYDSDGSGTQCLASRREISWPPATPRQ